MNRQKLLAAALGIIVLVSVIIWFLPKGYVTLNYNGAPISKVIQSVEHQAGVKIATNMDPSTPVTIHVQKVPVYEAIETLANNADASLRVAYIAASDSGKINQALTDFATSNNPGNWKAFGGNFDPMGMVGSSSADPRIITWNVSETADHSLQAILAQGSQKTGATFAVPADWNPVLGKMPATGETTKVAKDLFKIAKGKVEEVFLLTAMPRNGGDNAGGGGRGNGDYRRFQTIFSPDWRNRGEMNQDWVAERAQAQIAQLPEDERQQAMQIYKDGKAMFESLKDLPADQRQAKMEEFFERPDVQDAMEARMAARDSKTSPERREQRFRNYLGRKQEALQSAAGTKGQ